MDWSKYPLERLVFFVAAIIPGFTALVIFDLAHPHSFDWFFSLNSLGYRTKVGLVLAAAFVAGYSVSMLLAYFLAEIESAIAGSRPFKNPVSEIVAPWRDPRWRNAVKRYLGPGAPDDTFLITEAHYNHQKLLIEIQQREPQRSETISRLQIEKLKSEKNDSDWAQWYNQFHATVLTEALREWPTQVQLGLSFNMGATALYVLISSIWVPALRHWWTLTPAVLWVVFLILLEAEAIRRQADKWYTLSAQIKYFLGVKPVDQQQSLFGSSG